MVGTMGVALSVCTLPGQVSSDRLGPGKMELGLGIVRAFIELDSVSFNYVQMGLNILLLLISQCSV